MTIQQDVINSIRIMQVNGNQLLLPTDTQLSNYPQVKKVLTNAGGTYKRGGYFEFKTPASEIVAQLLGGNVIDDKQDFQMFFTPPSRAQKMANKANLKAGGRVLEPSAGHGALIDAALALAPDSDIVAVELHSGNAAVLKSKEISQLHNTDFLSLTPDKLGLFDSILLNPPFTKNQDIDHILHAFQFMAPNSTLVAIASQSWLTGNQKKQEGFRLWLEMVGADIEELPAGEFKESGTKVATTQIVITR